MKLIFGMEQGLRSLSTPNFFRSRGGTLNTQTAHPNMKNAGVLAQMVILCQSPTLGQKIDFFEKCIPNVLDHLGTVRTSLKVFQSRENM